MTGKFNKNDYCIHPIKFKTAERLVIKHHYTKNRPGIMVFGHGLFRKSDIQTDLFGNKTIVDERYCLGVAWWIPCPSEGSAKNTYDGNWRNVLALSRFVLIPDLPTNSASFLLGGSIKIIKKNPRWECLVTYADTYQKHEGIIYKATNWEYLGLTDKLPVWINEKGEMTGLKNGSKNKLRSNIRAQGYEIVGKYAKYKFGMLLHKNKGNLLKTGR